MPYTGLQFHTEFQRRVDKPFNDYYDIDTSKEFYRRVLTLGVKDKYEALDGQSRFDHLRGLIKYGITISASSGRVLLQPIAVSAYNSTTGAVTTQYTHNAIAGQTVEVNIQGTTGSLTGQFTVLTVVSQNEFTITPTAIGIFEGGFIQTEQSILDYLHLNALKVTYKIPVQTPLKTIVSKPNSIVLEFKTYTKLRAGQKVFIQDVLGSTNANGDRYVFPVGAAKYQLFSDAALSVPVTGNNEYISGGKVFYYQTTNKIFQSKPDEIQTYDSPSYEFPRWRITENAILLEPSSFLDSISVDYLTLPPFVIDPEDNEKDLLLYIPEEMVEFLIDKAAVLFDLETKNWNSLQPDNVQIITNK